MVKKQNKSFNHRIDDGRKCKGVLGATQLDNWTIDSETNEGFWTLFRFFSIRAMAEK